MIRQCCQFPHPFWINSLNFPLPRAKESTPPLPFLDMSPWLSPGVRPWGKPMRGAYCTVHYVGFKERDVTCAMMHCKLPPWEEYSVNFWVAYNTTVTRTEPLCVFYTQMTLKLHNWHVGKYFGLELTDLVCLLVHWPSHPVEARIRKYLHQPKVPTVLEKLKTKLAQGCSRRWKVKASKNGKRAKKPLHTDVITDSLRPHDWLRLIE